MCVPTQASLHLSLTDKVELKFAGLVMKAWIFTEKLGSV